MNKMLKRITLLSMCCCLGMACAPHSVHAEESSVYPYDLKGFDRVDASSAFRVEIIQGEKWSTQVFVDASHASCLRVEQRGDTLVLGTHASCQPKPWSKGPRAKVTMPVLAGLALSGAAQASLAGFACQEEVELDLSGASQLRGDLRAERVAIDLSGASQLQLKGGAAELQLDANGASQALLDDFEVAAAELELSGASHTSLVVIERLKAKASGMSRLYYHGSPQLQKVHTSGMSSIARR